VEGANDADYRLSGQRALITGASGGVGRAIALEFARAGASIVVHANRSLAEAEGLAHRLRGMGVRAVVLQADLRDLRACGRLVDQAFEAFGGLEAWVNNAGADILTGEAPGLSFPEKLGLLFEVDLRATMVLTREVGARMGKAGGGCIINIGWDQASSGMEGDSGELFGAVKGAVMSFTKSAALSLAPEVRVNCIAPGWIRTAWGESASEKWQARVVRETPLRRWGLPEDVARTARFLASPAAEYITAQVIRVNGGAVR
jgi:3-oxoacyl-[acyl-carrier protein] reductase